MRKPLRTPGLGGMVGVMLMMIACSGDTSRKQDLLASVGSALPESSGAWVAREPATRYTPETLYDYIDGHAEVYIAYDLRGSVARRYSGPDAAGDIVVDVFELATAADAYGVFTHDQDGDELAIGQGALFRYGWLSFWKGPFFASIYAEGESDEARDAVIELARAVATAIPVEGSRPAIVDALPAAGLEPRSVRYLHHPDILAAHRPLSNDNLLHLGSDAVAALGRYRRGDEGGHLLLVSYRDAMIAKQAAEAFRERFLGGDGGPVKGDDGWYAMTEPADHDETVLAFVLGAGSAELAKAILDETVEANSGGSP